MYGKISRDGTLYLDFSEHFAQYNKGIDAGTVDVGKYIHFANLPSLTHVRFGALITGGNIEIQSLLGDVGSNRKSMTSHLSILILWIRFVTCGMLPFDDSARESGISNKQYAKFFIPTSKLMIRILS